MSNQLNIEVACELLHLTRRQLMRRIDKGELPRPMKAGRDYKITIGWIEAALKKREMELLTEATVERLRRQSAQMLERVEKATIEEQS